VLALDTAQTSQKPVSGPRDEALRDAGITSGLPPCLDFLLVLTRDDVLRLKPFARENPSLVRRLKWHSSKCLGLSGGFISSASESHAAVMEIMARE
jgi:hypothetical protein